MSPASGINDRLIPVLDIQEGLSLHPFKVNRDEDCVVNPRTIAKWLESRGVRSLFVDVFDDAPEFHYYQGVVEDLCRETNLAIWLLIDDGRIDVPIAAQFLKLGVRYICLEANITGAPEAICKFVEACSAPYLAAVINTKQTSGTSWQAYTGTPYTDCGIDALEWAERVARTGIRKVIFNSIDREGREDGPDYALLEEVHRRIPSVEAVVSGGIRTPHNLEDVLSRGGYGGLIGSAMRKGSFDVDASLKLLACLQSREGEKIGDSATA